MPDQIKRRGGARPGAGRPPRKPAKLCTPATNDPLVFLLAAMNDPATDARLRIVAATSALPYVHAKKGEGIKDEKKAAAKVAGVGRFAPAAPPKLVSSK